MHLTRYRAIRLLIVTGVVLVLTNPAMAVSFQFGVSPSIAVQANVTTHIHAAIINTSDTPIDFGCARTPCGGLDFGIGVSRGGPDEGLNALNLDLNPFYTQFEGVVIAPTERFDFVFGRINFNPLEPVGNPFGTVLHPTLSFDFRNPPRMIASIPVTISVADQPSFAPFTFAAGILIPPSPPPTSVSVPSTLPLFASSLVVFLGWWSRKAKAIPASSPNL